MTPDPLAAEMGAMLARLFPITRSITGNGNRETLRTLQEVVPLTIHEIPTGTQVYDWAIPQEWNVRDAWIAGPDGRRIIDFRQSNLHVVSYSEPIRTTMGWDELSRHVHVHPSLPNAIPYRTSYYRRTWGFCVTHAQRDGLRSAGGPLEVVIDSDLTDGSLTYGELLIPGKSDREVLLSCYICHPSMANDSLSGVLTTAYLARELLARAPGELSYRVVFVPETIGAVAYCRQNEQAMRRIDTGLVITTVGGPGKFAYKQSFQPDHRINALIEQTFRDAGIDHLTYPFDVHGSDERQYSSPGFRINVATICRDRYYEYPEYHSSLDDLGFVSGARLAEAVGVYRGLISKLESERCYRNVIANGEVMLSRHDLYPATGGAQLPELGGRSELDLILWLLFLCDGRATMAEISARLGVDEERLDPIVGKLVGKGVLERV